MEILERNLATALSDLLAKGIDGKLFPSCGIGYSSPSTGFVEAYTQTLLPVHNTPCSKKTLYDIASLTKPIVGAVLLRLIDAGKMCLDSKVVGILHDASFHESWSKVTVQHLLTNSLELDLDKKLHMINPADALESIFKAPVKNLGDGYYYHNSHAIVVGLIIEKVLGMKLEKAVRTWVLKPAGMSSTFFYSEIKASRLTDIAPTEECPQRGITIIGVPHDETAYMFSQHGMAVGCAGIFSTIHDLIKFGEYISGDTIFNHRQYMMNAIMNNYLEAYGRTFGLCFDFPQPDYHCACFSQGTLVHTGFTGCVLWIRPEEKRVCVILSNATYPTRGQRGKNSPLEEFRKSVLHELFPCSTCTTQ